MKKLFLFLAASYLFIATGFSQTAPAIQWQNTIGGSDSDALYSIQQTTDGGYILGGFSNSNISGDKTENSNGDYDYWIVKTDATGNILWQNTIGGNKTDWLHSIQQTTDGGFICGGYSNSDISGDKTENCIGGFDPDYWIVKTDSLGNIQWQNTIGGTDYDFLSSVRQTFDGGYILGGFSLSSVSGDKSEICMGMEDYWIVKTDSLGNIQWQNTIGGSDSDWLYYAIRQTTDGGYILGGYSWSNISGDKTENNIGSTDYWVVKTDSLGNIQWQNTIGGGIREELYSIQQTTDGGYIFGGWSNSNISGDKTENCIGSRDLWILKTDSAGNIQWQNTIGGINYDDLFSLKPTIDDGYILGGLSDSNISGDKTENSEGLMDYWVIKLDFLGNILWQNTIGGVSSDNLFDIYQTTDKGYILGGLSSSNISGDKTENSNGLNDYWIIKLGPDTITGISPTPTLPEGEGVKIYPNPADEELTVSGLQFPVNKIEIINLLGETVFSREPPEKIGTGQTVNCKLQTSFLPPGIYIIKVYSDKGVFQQKLVVHHP